MAEPTEQDRRAAELETMIRNLRSLHGKLGEALAIAASTYVPGQPFEHELRVMRDDLNVRIAGYYRELKEIQA
jgi:hypothetical protein